MDASLVDKASSPPPRAKASRRSHRKSRNGCGNCKLRRVKCDEAKPGCGNCVQFEIECRYSILQSVGPPTSPAFLVSNGPRVQRRRGRPRTTWPERTSHSDDVASAPPLSLARMPDSYLSYSEDSLETYKCLHHYLTWTDDPKKIGSNADIVMRVKVPQLGFAYPFLLDFIHGFGALHLAHLQPQMKTHYHVLADRFCSIGLRGLSAFLPRVDMNNCQAIFAGAMFVCFNTFARGPLPGEFLLFDTTGPAIWFQLQKGVKSILSTTCSSTVCSGLLQGISGGPERADEPAAVTRGLPRLDWMDHFQQLRDAIVTSKDPDFALDLEALDVLWTCYEATWGGTDGNYQGDVNNQVIFTWMYYLKDGFVARLQSLRPLPLVIFAYFALLMKTTEDFWFFSGWPRHIIYGIDGELDEAHRAWLKWPLEVLDLYDKHLL
ncbi:hypothetical protein BKA56DRAFT_733497 [Ilyonectria sp. MPI-CAGE-AT-0026]|nr:hypothetical protein BKA56DRAFT_733497 [Ilyonectria sp. MPI-CAGE-AT-0026]